MYNIYVGTHCPDILLLSRARKTLVPLERTVPWEERIEEAHERKKAKYQLLLNEVGRLGTFLLRLEVGALLDSRGKDRVLGITVMTMRQAITEVCMQAESAA